jgi:hypothetical protein
MSQKRPAAPAGAASGAEINAGNPDFKLRWHNTLKYRAAVRSGKQQATLQSNGNNDDSNRNFNRGLISNRLNLVSEFDARIGAFGTHLCGEAWHDKVYTRRNDNPGSASGASPNPAVFAPERPAP